MLLFFRLQRFQQVSKFAHRLVLTGTASLLECRNHNGKESGMAAEEHYHERIARATARLAQLQAKGLLTTQRQAAKAKEQQRRDEVQRRKRVADLVFAVGAEELEDAEIVGALLLFQKDRQRPEMREEAASLGARFLVQDEAASRRPQ